MHMFDVYPLYDVEIVRGLGSYVWDAGGARYLDMYGGHAVISVGHSHPFYIKKIADQLGKIGFYSNSVRISLQEELAAKLETVSGKKGYRLFLCNSGAEANENALKLASFHNRRKHVIAFTNSFHGRTSLAVSVTDNAAIRAPINENPNVSFLQLEDFEALEDCFSKHDVCAVIIEGIQGVGGVNIVSPAFLKKIRSLCTENGSVYIADAVQCGYGRSGKFFSHDFSEVDADIYTLAKGMANGFPIGGILISPDIKAKYGLLGTTFGGNYLACAAALAVLEIFEKENLVENAFEQGLRLKSQLQKLGGVKEVRGAGLMIGIEMHFPIEDLRKNLVYEQQVFTGSSNNKNTLRLLPSLALSKGESDEFVARFTALFAGGENLSNA